MIELAVICVKQLSLQCLNFTYFNNDEHTQMDKRTGNRDILDMAFISTELREMHVSFLPKTSFPNKDYRAEKLRSKIEQCKEYQGIIDFTHSGNNEATGKFQSCLIYNKTIELDCAVTQAHQSGQSDLIKYVGLFLRESVLKPMITGL